MTTRDRIGGLGNRQSGWHRNGVWGLEARPKWSLLPLSLTFLCILAIAFLPSAALGRGVEWIRQFGSPGHETAAGVAAGADGNVYIAGDTDGALPGQTETGSHDAFVRKYDSQGNEVWTRQFGLDDPVVEYVRGKGVAVGPGGNVFVVGETSGTFPGEVSFGPRDGFLRKYDPDGNEVWTRQFGSSSFDDVSGVTVGPGGAIYIVGETVGAMPGQTQVGGSDVFVCRYESDGNLIWIRQFGTALPDDARAVSVDPDGNAYVAGVLEDDGGWGDFILRKYDPSGAEIWTERFCAAPDSCWASAVAVDANGNPHVAGGVRGTLPGQTRTAVADAFVRKYDADGVERWTRQFGSSIETHAGGVAVDTLGDVWVAGYTWAAFPGHTGAGGADIFVRKYDDAGNELWTCQSGSTDDDYGYELIVDSNDSAYPCGQTRGALPGQTHVGGADVFLMKFHPGCAIVPAAIAQPASVCPGGDAVLDASATAGQTCVPRVIEYAWTEDPSPPHPGATCGPGQVLDCWAWGNTTLALTNLTPPPGEDSVTRWLWVRPRGEPDCVNPEPYPVTVEVLPDPLPPATGNGFCLEREDEAILFRWTLLPGDVGGYEVLELDGDIDPPTPAAFEAVPAPLAVAGALESELSVPGTAVSPQRLVFFKLRATSPCTGTPGPACDGFPGQVPCP